MQWFFFSTLLISGVFCHTMSFCPIKHASFQHLFFCSRMCHQTECAKDSCHRARSSEAALRSAVTRACFTCRASLASRPPPHSGEHAKSSLMCSTEAFLHIPHICFWFTEQVTSPACLNSCFADHTSPPRRLPPPNWGGLKTTCSPLPVRFASAGGTWQWPDVQPLLGTVWIIYLLNLALAWHFDVWRLEAPALTI